VCSYYAGRFNDGTTIKFIYQPGSAPPAGVFGVPARRECEAAAREGLAVQAHGTPGVADHHSAAGAAGCPELDVAAAIRPLAAAAAAQVLAKEEEGGGDRERRRGKWGGR
jgi:hypothetical protein